MGGITCILFTRNNDCVCAASAAQTAPIRWLNLLGDMMIKIEKLQPGMIVYDLHTHKMGNTTITTWGVWEVQIIEVDVPNLKVVASWNGNPPQNYYGSSFKWRKDKPLMVKTWGNSGQRPATREELSAHKAKKAAESV